MLFILNNKDIYLTLQHQTKQLILKGETHRKNCITLC